MTRTIASLLRPSAISASIRLLSVSICIVISSTFPPTFLLFVGFSPRGHSAALGRCWGTYAPANHANFFNHHLSALGSPPTDYTGSRPPPEASCLVLRLGLFYREPKKIIPYSRCLVKSQPLAKWQCQRKDKKIKKVFPRV